MRIPLLAAVLVAAIPAAVSAQVETGSQPGRSYRGLFGSGLQGSNHQLTFDANVSGGFDDNVLTAEPDPTTSQPQQSTKHGSFQQGGAGLNYRLNVTRVQLSARVHGSMSHYAERRRPTRNYRGELGSSLPLWGGAQFGATFSATMRPFYNLPWLQGAALEDESLGPEVPLDESAAGAFVEVHTTTGAGAFFNQDLTKRVRFSSSYMYNRSHSHSRARDFAAQSGRGGLDFSLTRGLGLRVGYGYSDNRYQRQSVYRARNIDFGLNYNRALSLTRRTRLSFATGTTGIVDRDRTFYRFDADVRLSRELARTWTAQLVYRRDVSFDETFRQPAPLDSVSIAVAGLFSRRLRFNSSLGLVQGRIGLESNANAFETYFGRAALTVALSRMLGVGVDYTYFQFRFDSQAGLPIGLVRRADRQRVRVFLTLRTALFSSNTRGGR